MNEKSMSVAYALLSIAAAVLLFWALDRHSYDYYTLLRFTTCGVSAFGSYLAFKRQSPVWGFALAGMALLFNPIFPVGMKRQTWAKIDVGAGIVLLASAVFTYRAARKE